MHNIRNFLRGWIIGNFQPSLYKTKDFEVGIKEYKSGDYEKSHYHKLSKEFTVIISGKVRMNNIEYTKGDIVIINESERTDFECIEDCITVVIRNKSIKNDKYL
jgi:hypothetical protein